RPACFRDSGAAYRFRVSSCAYGAEAGNQRMADARAHRQARDVPQRVSRADQERWRCLRSLCRLEGYFLRGLHPSGGRGLRALVRAIRADWPAGSDDHPDRTETRLLLPMAVCLALLAAALARNTGPAHRSRAGYPRIAPSSVPLGRRREELEAAANRRLDRDVDCRHSRNLYAS